MPKVNVIGSKQLEKLKKKSGEILDIYNEGAGFKEFFEMNYPQYCHIAYIKGVKGGVQLEMISGKYGIIYFAGFEENDRGKGYLRKCVEALAAKFPVYGVQVEAFGDDDLLKIWGKLGFVHEGMLNWTKTLFNLPQEDFNKLIPDHEKKSQAESIAEMIAGN